MVRHYKVGDTFYQRANIRVSPGILRAGVLEWTVLASVTDPGCIADSTNAPVEVVLLRSFGSQGPQYDAVMSCVLDDRLEGPFWSRTKPRSKAA